MSPRTSLCIVAICSAAGCSGTIDDLNEAQTSEQEVRKRCGDGRCTANETCTSCPQDCGVCAPTPICGDGACNGSETCSSCAGDCGACPVTCGDGTCSSTESCSSCAADCGACPASGRGPTPDIACPAGSVYLAPGTDVNAAVEAAPPGTAFCYGKGTHRPTRPIYAEANDQHIGEYGAVIDGSLVTRSWDVGGIAVLSGWNCVPACNDVTVRNLTITNSEHMCLGVFSNGNDGTPLTAPTHPSDNWVIDHNEFSYCRSLNVGNQSGARVTNNVVTHATHGMTGYLSRNTLLENNEVSFASVSPFGMRFNDSLDLTIRNHHSHDFAPGLALLWLDGQWGTIVIEDSRFDCTTEWPCVDLEYTQRTTTSTHFRRNVLNMSSAPNPGGLWITNTANVEAYENVFNAPLGGGAAIFWDGVFDAVPVQNNRVYRNTFNLGGTARWVGFQCSGPLTSDGCRDAMISKGNAFDGNVYNVPSLSGSYWYAGGGGIGWSQWQAIGQDLTGSVMLR
jgi:hypothetical protein